MIKTRRIRAWGLLTLTLLGLAVAFQLATGYAAREVSRRIQGVSDRLGLETRVQKVHVGLFPVLEMNGVEVLKPGVFSARTSRLRITPGLGGPDGLTLIGRVSLDEVRMALPAETELRLLPSTWEMGRERTLTLRSPGQGLAFGAGTGQRGPVIDGQASQLDLDPLVVLVIEDTPTRGLGRLDAVLRVEGDPRVDFQGLLRAASLGGRTTLSVVVTPVGAETRVEVLATLDRLDLAWLFGALGLDGSPPRGELGLLSGSITASGLLSDPASLKVIESLKFKPPGKRPASISRLNGDFVHEVVTNQGATIRIDVSRASPDFIALPDVPPLFIRALLIAEDAAFFSHPGVDLAEIPRAVATNWARGEAVRGASTITQQLAKNLFLTREKSLHRKIRELSYSFLLESTVGKVRILEIYLNIIEWGPGLYGLRPAARHYFGKDPGALSPREIAFLVSLIPGPIKYQGSILGGEIGPGFQTLIDNLLAKLLSVDALTEEEYERARAETVILRDTADEPEAPPAGVR